MYRAENSTTPDRNVLLRRGLQALATVAVTLVAAGCGTANKPKPPTHLPATPKAPVTVKTPPVPKPEAPLNAQTYGTSMARSKALFAAIQAPGKKIVELSQSGAVGPFDFYSSQTKSYSSQSASTHGWGWLQHNPQYGGVPDELSVFVYKDIDGAIDLHKGIQGISTNVKGQPLVEIDSNEESHVISPNIPFGTLGWQVSFTYDLSKENSINPSDDSSLAYTVAAVKHIDRTALAGISASLHELGVN
jgi:hypothetical protein